VSNDSKQALATARCTVNTLFIQFLSLLFDDVGRVLVIGQGIPDQFLYSRVQHTGRETKYMRY
jgi:hypothetical protein